MTRDEAKEYIRENLSCEEFLERSRSSMYCCPFCDSGNGIHHTGALKLYVTNTWTCHNCKRSGDVLDLIENEKGMNFNEALKWAADRLGITIDPFRPQGDYLKDLEREGGETHTSMEESKQEATQSQEKSQEKPNLIPYYKECKKRLRESQEAQSYLTARGISVDIALSFGIGYDDKADPAGSGYPCKRIIVPSSATHYMGRSIQPNTPNPYTKMNNKGGTAGIFNEGALYDEAVKTIFITEGPFDALSFVQVGAAAIALFSTSNADHLIKRLEEKPTQASLIICLDNDGRPSTKNAVQTLKEGLERLKINYAVANVSGDHKDPNDFLVADRKAFEAAVAKAQRRVEDRPDNVAAYIDGYMMTDIEQFRAARERKTGYENLDQKTGGLYSGLYVMAAISSLGKTTFTHQLCDQMAMAGHEVIFFSLEQSRLELVSKSLTRIIAEEDPQSEIDSLSLRRGYNGKEMAAAAEKYKEKIGTRLSIIEGNFNCDTEYVCNYVRQHIQRTGTKPVVVVDYLQILQPGQAESGRSQSVREMVDITVKKLKIMSRDLDIPVIVISSVNRGNYLQPIDFESLKESGGIEYSADVIWGLQLHCLNDELFNKSEHIKEKRETVKKAKRADPRMIDLVCLKNRYGISSFECHFNYYPGQDLFIPATLEEWGEKDEEEVFGKV